MNRLSQINHLVNSTIAILFIIIWSSCQNNYTPKPRGYFRIELPEKKYSVYNSIEPYTFEIPQYAKVIPDTSFNAEKYWVNIVYPKFNGKLHLSYKKVHNNIDILLEDNRKLAFKHSIKADAIGEQLYTNEETNVYGLLYDIKGNAASSVQFFVTDSTKHFLRGSLYFNSQPNKDSLAPVSNFIKEDIRHMMETFTWK